MSSPVAQRSGNHNKYKHSEEIRRLHRQARLALGREKITDTEDLEKQLRELREQADALDIDPDILAEEEVALGDEREEIEAYDEQLEEQLEDYIADAELELEQQLKDLQLDERPQT